MRERRVNLVQMCSFRKGSKLDSFQRNIKWDYSEETGSAVLEKTGNSDIPQVWASFFCANF